MLPELGSLNFVCGAERPATNLNMGLGTLFVLDVSLSVVLITLA